MNDTEKSESGNGLVLGWLTRTYNVHQAWIERARGVYFATNGNSELSRQRVACIVRAYFLDEKPSTETVRSWSGGVVVDEKVEPPTVTSSNASYFDWIKVADYLLLPCSSITDEYEEENQRRESDYQTLLGSYTLRMQINAARRALRVHPEADDASLLAIAKEEYIDASLANVKEARKLEAARAPLHKPIEPKRAGDMPRYKALPSSLGTVAIPEAAR